MYTTYKNNVELSKRTPNLQRFPEEVNKKQIHK